MKESNWVQIMMIQEFQHSGQFESIEVIKTKMLDMHFEAIVNSIQIKSIKQTYKTRNIMIHQCQQSVQVE
jgi:hypothetical protein